MLNCGDDLLAVKLDLLDHGSNVDCVLHCHEQLHECVVEFEKAIIVRDTQKFEGQAGVVELLDQGVDVACASEVLNANK